jgi:REP element-mobilizing transposase RayT
MARPWRIQFPDALYHVTARGNNRQAIFLEEADKRTFLDTLATAVSRFDLHLFAFCLMDNHYHLFLRTPKGNLSRAMHWLNCTYTRRIFQKYHRGGHLLQGRYKAVVVADEGHWLHLSMYLHLNPVRAGMVQDPADYEWSSFRDYTRPRSRFAWLKPEEILAQSGRGAGSRRRYRSECMGLSGQAPSFWQEIRSAVVLGPAEVVEELAKKYGPAGKREAVPEFRQASRPGVKMEDELDRVAAVFGVKRADLNHRRRNFPPRLAAYYHLVEHCGFGVTEVGAVLVVSAMAVSLGVRRFRERLGSEPALAKLTSSLSLK